jgi:hypothetical protein
MPSSSQCSGGTASRATSAAGIFRRAARSLAAARESARLAALAWREQRGDWRATAMQRFLGHAVDAPDLERRQRIWDRDESNSYSMAGWS